MSLLQVAQRSRSVLRTLLHDSPDTVRENSDRKLRRDQSIEALIVDLTREIEATGQQPGQGKLLATGE